MTIEIPEAITQYFPYLPKLAFAFLIAFLLTPMIGKLAKKLGFMDLPSQFRSRRDNTKDRRMHKKAIPRLGGLAIIISFFITLAVFDNVPSEITGILIGMGIITIGGLLDDRYEISGKVQISFQLLAVIIVIISGVTVTSLSLAGQEFNLVTYTNQINFLGLEYLFRFPADFLTLFWILLVTNALAWVCGIDALGESMTFVASVVFGALSMKLVGPEYTLIFFIFAGSVLGFIPYNFPKAKIFGGSVGHLNYGFFLATMAIQSETKLVSAVMILSIPLLDMFWVLINRIKNNSLKSPFDLLAISDRTHLHHRIMNLGFNSKETLYIELLLFAIISLGAFYLGGFSFDFIILSSIFVLLLIAFAIVGILYKNKWERNSKKTTGAKRPPIEQDTTPEQRYAY